MSIQQLKEKRTVAIDPDTDEGLDWLKQQLDSPKAWILRRLVAEEIERLQAEKRAREVKT